MATSVGRWLLDEASSGTTPTTAADDTGNSNTLTVDYSSGDAAWTSVASGNGVDFTATVATASTAILTLSDIANNGNIGSSFDGSTTSVKQLSFIIVFDIDAGDASGPRLVQIGTDSGDGDFAIGTRGSDWLFRWSKESGGSDVTYPVPGGGYGTGLMVMAVVIDSTETTAADRIKVYYNNVLQTANSGTIALNEGVDLNNSAYNFSLGNRESLNRNVDGKIYYAELFTGTLTTQEVSDAHTALISDNDSDWQAGPTIVNLTGQASTSGQGAVTATGDSLTALTGQSVTSGQGALNVEIPITQALTGQESTSGQGALDVNIGTVTQLTGQESTVGQGALSVSAGVTVSITGQGTTAGQGTLVATGDSLVPLSGQVSTSAQGSVTVITDTVVALSGQQSISNQGTIGLQAANILTLTGQEASTGQGTVIASGGGWTEQPDTSTNWTQQTDATTIWTKQ